MTDFSAPDAPVRFALDAGVATITINRPTRRNALSVAVCQSLHALWERVDRDPEIRVAILTSTDCGTFCAGMDLKEAAEIRAREGRDILEFINDPFHQRMRAVGKPLIAAMTGHFTAGGMVLAANCDLRVGLVGTKGGISEAKVGRGSPWAVPMLWMLHQPFLMELVLTGDMYPIDRFREYGFVNYIEDTPDQVRDRARQLAESINANAPLSVLAGKRSLLMAMDLGCALGFKQAEYLYRSVYASQDAIEGPRAFSEKRKPNWTGR